MTVRILNHGLRSFGSYCGLNYAYAYIKNIVTYTEAVLAMMEEVLGGFRQSWILRKNI